MEDLSDIPVPPSHRHPMSGEPVWDAAAVREVIEELTLEFKSELEQYD